MSEFAVPKRQEDPDPAAEAYLSRVEAELNTQHQELRDQARALLAAVKGRRGIRSEEDWQATFEKAKINYESGRFLIEKLGAERYLEPELMATLAQLRRNLLPGIEDPTAADTMMADSAILAYHNMLRVQGCSVPWCDGMKGMTTIIDKGAVWDKYSMAAPRPLAPSPRVLILQPICARGACASLSSDVLTRVGTYQRALKWMPSRSNDCPKFTQRLSAQFANSIILGLHATHGSITHHPPLQRSLGWC
jgi:hypothetical protein